MAGLLDTLVNNAKAVMPSTQQSNRVVQSVTNPYSYATAQPLQYLLQGGTFGAQAVQPGGNYGGNVQPGFVPASIANAQAQQNPISQGQFNWNNL